MSPLPLQAPRCLASLRLAVVSGEVWVVRNVAKDCQGQSPKPSRPQANDESLLSSYHPVVSLPWLKTISPAIPDYSSHWMSHVIIRTSPCILILSTVPSKKTCLSPECAALYTALCTRWACFLALKVSGQRWTFTHLAFTISYYPHTLAVKPYSCPCIFLFHL